jgi:DNA-binding transcriptional LysR family regulator
MPASRNLSLSDLLAVRLVQRLGSVSGAARELDVTASQVSKALARVEAYMGEALFLRGSRGMALTETGRRLLPRLDDIIDRLRSIRAQEMNGSLLTVAAPSYICTFLLPDVAAALSDTRVRALEMPPSLVRAFAPAGIFDAVLLLGPPRLPENWSITGIGVCRKGVLAAPRLARRLGPSPVSAERLKDVPFVSPIYSVNGQFVPVDDDCPLGVGERRAGHEAQTIGVALQLAARVEQLVFGPIFAAADHLRRGSLAEVTVEGWSASEAMHLACNVDRVTKPLQTALARASSSALEALERELAPQVRADSA